MNEPSKKPFLKITREGDKTNIEATCISCGKVKQFTIAYEDFLRWEAGELLQNVFPKVSVDDRELLISGMCGPCFDRLFMN